MSNSLQELRDDVAFIRSLTEESGRALAHTAALLAAAGVLFGICALQYWMVYAGFLGVPRSWRSWLWLIETILFFAVAAMISRRRPLASGQAARAVRAAGAGVGVGISIAGVALFLGSSRAQVPWLPAAVLPIIIFTLYGAAWGVASAILRRAALTLVAGGCFLTAILCGWLLGSPAEWLALSIGLFALVALPGFIVWRNASRS